MKQKMRKEEEKKINRTESEREEMRGNKEKADGTGSIFRSTSY